MVRGKRFFFFVALWPLMLGCGSQAPPCSVAGEASYAGKPIATGSIRFAPISGTKGPGGGAVISGGKYQVPQEQGMLPGSYLVQIFATRETGRSVRRPEAFEPGESATISEVEQYIPAAYNAKSKLTVVLEAGENPGKVFDLKVPPPEPDE